MDSSSDDLHGHRSIVVIKTRGQSVAVVRLPGDRQQQSSCAVSQLTNSKTHTHTQARRNERVRNVPSSERVERNQLVSWQWSAAGNYAQP